MPDEIRRVRLEKIAKLRALGVDPFPAARPARSHGCADARDFAAKNQGETVSVVGRVMLRRVMGGIAFLTLRDESGEVQVTLKKGETGLGREGSFTPTNAVILHGMPVREKPTEPNERHWLPWLRDALVARGTPTTLPLVPDSMTAPPEAWMAVLDDQKITDETVLIAHSAGAAAAVRWLSQNPTKEIKKLILVAPAKIPSDEDFAGERLYDFEIDPGVRERIGEVVIFVSDDEDRHRRAAEIYRDALGARVVELPGRGHFMEKEMGAREFPELLAEVLTEIQPARPDFPALCDLLDRGDLIAATGETFLTKKGEPSILAREIKFLAKSVRPLPDKVAGLQDDDARFRRREVDFLMSPDSRRAVEIFSDLERLVREFFWAKNFREMRIPVLENVASGTAAKPFKTHMGAYDADVFLRIASGEIPLKKLTVSGFEKIFHLGPVFRNEGVDPGHNPEFNMVEAYWGYHDYGDMMGLMEEFFTEVHRKILGGQPVVRDGEEINFAGPFPKISFHEALRELGGIDPATVPDEASARAVAEARGVDVSRKIGYAEVLDELYKKTARPKLRQPTWLTDYPRELIPLAKRHPDRPDLIRSAQLVVQGSELVKLYSELTDPVEQAENFASSDALEARGAEEAITGDADFVEAMEHGMPPMVGMGMGIETTARMLAGAPDLREVILFPFMRPEKKQLSRKEAEEKYRSKKVVVIADESLPAGVAANAIGQLGIEIGGHSDEKLFESTKLWDADGRTHWTDCFYGMSNLAGTREQMAKFVEKCHAAEIQVFDFSDIMRRAHTDKQMLEGYRATKTSEIQYFAVGALIPAEFEKDWLGGLRLFGAGEK